MVWYNEWYKDWTERSKKCQCLKKNKKNKQKNTQKDRDETWKSIAQTNLKKLQESLTAWKQKEMKRRL